jgi:hypothetical protein
MNMINIIALSAGLVEWHIPENVVYRMNNVVVQDVFLTISSVNEQLARTPKAAQAQPNKT